jgi:hypothetical protein
MESIYLFLLLFFHLSNDRYYIYTSEFLIIIKLIEVIKKFTFIKSLYGVHLSAFALFSHLSNDKYYKEKGSNYHHFVPHRCH